MMKFIATSDWHIGNLFHGNDRLPEHKHFLQWLLALLTAERPDALLVAGDIFDNGNPSAAAQSAYYEFLADATRACPGMQIIITAGNHDSANRLEAPRALLSRHSVEVRGLVHRSWRPDEEGGGRWEVDFDDLMIPIRAREGDGEAVVLAVPYLRNDVLQSDSYSRGVNTFLRELTAKARAKYPGKALVMMAHMYARGADIAQLDASEKIVIGGLEAVDMEGWADHPDYMTCGHIHKRQHLWNTSWARYTGSVLPMSVAEADYTHGVDVITIEGSEAGGRSIRTNLREYVPQHRLLVLPNDDEGLSPKKLKTLIEKELPDRRDGQLDDSFVYLFLKVKLDKASNDDLTELHSAIGRKNAVLCRMQKVMPGINLSTMADSQQIRSIDDILKRNPLDTLKEAFALKHNEAMSEHQEAMLKTLLHSIDEENNET